MIQVSQLAQGRSYDVVIFIVNADNCSKVTLLLGSSTPRAVFAVVTEFVAVRFSVAAPGADRNRAHRAGKPWQNATDESFNGKFRDEYLSLQWFRNRVDAKVGIVQWRRHYNDVRPHSSLGYLTPAEFKAQLRAGSDDGGRSPAMPAHADQEEHESDLTMPTGAVLQ